jgi:UDP-glucose 4-epimerase
MCIISYTTHIFPPSKSFKTKRRMPIMKKVGITGAAGYIGSRVCSELKNHHDIVPIDNFHTGKIRHIDGIRIIEADIRDKKSMERLLDVDCIAHLAAIPGVEPCNKNRELVYDVNVNGTRTIAEICQEQSIPVIFASTFGVIGDPQYFPIDEHHPVRPMHWYVETKFQGEKIISQLSRDHFPSYLLRKSNVYGTHTIDYTTIAKPTVINRFVEAVVIGQPLIIYNPGTQARNFLHVKDAAHAYSLALSHIVKAPQEPEIFCIASAESVSIKGLTDIVISVAEEFDLSPSIEVQKNPRKETLVEDFSITTQKAHDCLGYSPHYTIEQAVREMIETSINSQ